MAVTFEELSKMTARDIGIHPRDTSGDIFKAIIDEIVKVRNMQNRILTQDNIIRDATVTGMGC